MHHADHLTVVHHDDTTTTFEDVRYTLTAAGLRILDAAGAETTLQSFDVLTSIADSHRSDSRPEATS